MELVLEIQHEKDLQLLLPMLERLKIKVLEWPSRLKPNGLDSNKKEGAGKNYDPEQLASMFKQLQAMNAFSDISDPVAWQKQLRDEWE